MNKIVWYLKFCLRIEYANQPIGILRFSLKICSILTRPDSYAIRITLVNVGEYLSIKEKKLVNLLPWKNHTYAIYRNFWFKCFFLTKIEWLSQMTLSISIQSVVLQIWHLVEISYRFNLTCKLWGIRIVITFIAIVFTWHRGLKTTGDNWILRATIRGIRNI